MTPEMWWQLREDEDALPWEVLRDLYLDAGEELKSRAVELLQKHTPALNHPVGMKPKGTRCYTWYLQAANIRPSASVGPKHWTNLVNTREKYNAVLLMKTTRGIYLDVDHDFEDANTACKMLDYESWLLALRAYVECYEEES